VAGPPGCEPAARAFYGGLAGLREIPKPPDLAARGGVWFALGRQALHIGVEQDFRPALKAHPAFSCEDADELAASLEARGRARELERRRPGHPPLLHGRPRSATGLEIVGLPLSSAF